MAKKVNLKINNIPVSVPEGTNVLEAAREGREPLLLPKFSCHHLRHTFATRLCQICSNIKVIQYIMGHKEISTTMEIYAEATDEKNKEVFEELSAELGDLF